MTTVRWSRMRVIVGILCTGAALIPAAAADATARTTTSLVKIAQIGDPAWTPVDLHVFAAPIGTASDGYAEFATTLGNVLPAPHYQPNPCLGIGPGTPELPPYDHDVADGVSNAGYLQGHVFGAGQFSNGSGVYLAYMVVPSPTSQSVGSSPDFSQGPIVPNALFPIHITGVTDRNSTTYDPFLANFDVPALNTLTTPCTAYDVDGSSHFPIFLADNSDFGPPGTKLPGAYTYSVTMRDATGAGWSILARFTVR